MSNTHRVDGAIRARQIQMDQAVGLRQEEIQVLETETRERERERSHMKLMKWSKNGAVCVFVSRWVLLRSLTEASSPERTPGFLLRSRCRRELEYSSLEQRA